MTSQLNVDTIVDKAGTGGTNIKVGNDATYVAEGGSANSNNVVQGLSKAWHKANAAGSTLNDSLNVSSLGDQGTGQQVINLSNNMNNANYMGAQGVWTNISEPFLFSQATSSYKSYGYDEAGGAYTDAEQGSMIMGDLA